MVSGGVPLTSSGVPDEVPFDLTRRGLLQEARASRTNLIERLGLRLGISGAGGSALESGRGVTESERKPFGDRKRLKESNTASKFTGFRFPTS